MRNLLELSLSQYSNVRATAQDALTRQVNNFTQSYKLLIPGLVEKLKDSSDVTHEQFKVLVGSLNFL